MLPVITSCVEESMIGSDSITLVTICHVCEEQCDLLRFLWSVSIIAEATLRHVLLKARILTVCDKND